MLNHLVVYECVRISFLSIFIIILINSYHLISFTFFNKCTDYYLLYLSLSVLQMFCVNNNCNIYTQSVKSFI